jgi:hypothetical protein
VGHGPQGGKVGPLGVQDVCMRVIFILNEIWTQDKIYIYIYIYIDRHYAWLIYVIYHLLQVLAPNYKQHILSVAKVKKKKGIIH